MIARTPQRAQISDAGFSLLEMLIALGILSLTSLALFQSMGSMLAVSEKASSASIDIAENSITHESFAQVIGGLTPGWDEAPYTVFLGTSTKLSGLSTNMPSKRGERLNAFTLEFKYDLESDENSLLLIVDSKAAKLHTFTDKNYVFRYLGQDQVWYDHWPLDVAPTTGFFNDSKFAKPSQLPIAIKISPERNTASSVSEWGGAIIALQNSGKLPVTLNAFYEK